MSRITQKSNKKGLRAGIFQKYEKIAKGSFHNGIYNLKNRQNLDRANVTRRKQKAIFSSLD